MLISFIFSESTDNPYVYEERVYHGNSQQNKRVVQSIDPYDNEFDYLEKNAIIFIFIFIALSCFVKKIMS